MDLRRLKLLLRARWGVLLLLTIIGVGSGLAFSRFQSRTAEPVYRAEAPLTVLEDPLGAEGQMLQSGIDAVVAEATTLHAGVLRRPGVEIRPDYLAGQVVFLATGSSSEEAAALAHQLRQAYRSQALAEDAQELEGELDALTRQVLQAEQELADLEGAVLLAPETQAEVDFITGQIEALSQRAIDLSVQLTVTRASPPTELEIAAGVPTVEQLELELGAVQIDLAALQGRLQELTASAPPLSREESLRKAALELQRDALKTEYGERYIEYNEVLDLQDDPPEPVTAVNATAALPSPITNGGLGGLTGLLVGLAALILSDRVRQPVWSAADIKTVPILGEVSPR